MSQILFEILEGAGLKPGKIGKAIESWDEKTLSQFIESCIESEKRPEETESIFDFFASSQLSGGPAPCMHLNCRMGQANSLSAFAALYADRVLVRNPFGKYEAAPATSSVRDFLADDVRILYRLRPLLDAGLMEVATERFHICGRCLERLMKDEKPLRERFSEAGDFLKQEITNNVEFSLTELENVPYIDASGLEDFLGQRVVIVSSTDALHKTWSRGGQHKLTPKELTDLGIIEHLIQPVISDMFMSHWYGHFYGANYITDRPADFRLLAVSGDEDLIVRNNALYEGLAHVLPVLRTADLSTLVKLRNKEREAFEVYRDALSRVLRSLKDENDPEAVRQALNEEVRPEINKINSVVKNFQRDAQASLITRSLITTGFVGIGLFSGLLPPDIGGLLAALGGYHFVRDVGKKIREWKSTPSLARENRYYFLWKAGDTLPR